METFISRNYLWRWLVDFKASSPAAIPEMMDLFSKSHLLWWKCGIQGFIVWDGYVESSGNGYVDFNPYSLEKMRRSSGTDLWKWKCGFQAIISGDGYVDFKPPSLEMDAWISSHHLWLPLQRWSYGIQGYMEFKESSLEIDKLISRNHLLRWICGFLVLI